jgi:glycosyltransferase involved in cell wall biosynthesis
MSLPRLTPAEWILASTLLLSFLTQLLFYRHLYSLPLRRREKKKKIPLPVESLPPITIILTSKNSAEMLSQNLPLIMEQDYPDFEVIAVNRGSIDDTDTILKVARYKYPHLYHTYIPKDADTINEKKLALTLAIKAAKNNCLLFTEANCRPCSKHWLREFGEEFAQGKEVILGFSRLEIPLNTPLRGLMQYDNLIHHLKFLSMATLGKPFMGSGRNLAYKKDLFYKHKGYSSILNREGGEDDLYINRIAPPKKTGVALSPKSMTETCNINRFSEWRTLKSAYLHTRRHYKGYAFRIFSLETLTKYTLYLSLISAPILGTITGNHILTVLALTLFIIRYTVQKKVINRNSHHFNAGEYRTNLLFYDIFQPLSNIRLKKYTTKRKKIKSRSRSRTHTQSHTPG